MGEGNSNQNHVIIAGAGLSGALMAIYLAKAGYRVDIFEHRPDPRNPRKVGIVGGRSINLAISTRAITALKEVGLDEAVLKDAVRMPGRMIHDREGNLTFQPYSSNQEDAINSVSRGGLNVCLLEAADKHDNVTIRFQKRCIDADLNKPAITLKDEQTGETTQVEADFVIGADGAFSAVRDSMLRNVNNFSYSQDFLEHGYKELVIPPTATGSSDNFRGFAIEANALHIWPRNGSMMIALPNADKTFTCTLFWPFEGEHGFSAINSAADVMPFFKKHYGDAVNVMPTLVEDYEKNPTSSLATIRCKPWYFEDKVVLIGDAAHAVVPFYGQGINAGFEDCRILNQCLIECKQDRIRAFKKYFKERKENADAIADLALANFIEMRDSTASKMFLLKKKFEQTVHKLLPNWFIPLYNMVSFSNVPYAEARKRAKEQWTIIMAAAVCIAVVILLGCMGLIALIF